MNRLTRNGLRRIGRGIASGLGLGLTVALVLALAVGAFVASVPWLALVLQ